MDSEALEDSISHPAHYTQGRIECIDAMRSAFGEVALMDYCVMNAFKYIWRHRLKECPSRDLGKARWYLDYALHISEDIDMGRIDGRR